ncbi:MAG: metallopeptidase TldD-related protein [Jatrophihabitans sp.]
MAADETAGGPSMPPPLDPDAVLEAFDVALRSTDADELELCLLGRAGEFTRFAGGRIHQPQDITEAQVLVRAVVDGHARRGAVTILRDLPAAVARTAATARRASAGRPSGEVQLAAARDAAEPAGLRCADTLEFDAAARGAAVRSALAEAAAAGGEVAGMFGRALTQQVVATSTGVRLATTATEASGALTAEVGDGTSHWIDLGRSARGLDVPGAVAEAIALGARGRNRGELPAGEYTVVLGCEAVGELLQFLPGFGFDGEQAATGIGLCAKRAGELVGSTLVTVGDDGSAEVGLPIGFDIEGTPRRLVPFFTAGLVGDPVTDLATARALGTPSTGHAHIAREEVPSAAASNIVMAAGDLTEAELIAGVIDGVYLQRFWYTQVVDAERGSITGVSRDGCFRIRGGELAEPIAGMRFTQSVLDLLGTVDAVGNQRRGQPIMNVWNGASVAPAIRAHGFGLGVRS